MKYIENTSKYIKHDITDLEWINVYYVLLSQKQNNVFWFIDRVKVHIQNVSVSTIKIIP